MWDKPTGDPFHQHPGNEIGRIYKISKEDAREMKHERGYEGWIRIKPGFICLCISHSGDFHNEYILLQVGENFVKPILESKFGAYEREISSKPLEWTPSEREFHLLLAGETISVLPTIRHPLKKELEKINGKLKSQIKTTYINCR